MGSDGGVLLQRLHELYGTVSTEVVMWGDDYLDPGWGFCRIHCESVGKFFAIASSHG